MEYTYKYWGHFFLCVVRSCKHESAIYAPARNALIHMPTGEYSSYSLSCDLGLCWMDIRKVREDGLALKEVSIP